MLLVNRDELLAESEPHNCNVYPILIHVFDPRP
jgi:hypothetical protein